ncbi:amidase [compost metagenome]
MEQKNSPINNPVPDSSTWIIEADITSMQAEMTRGLLTSVQLVQLYLERIGRHDNVINAVLELNPDALEMAAQLDQERLVTGPRGGL